MPSVRDMTPKLMFIGKVVDERRTNEFVELGRQLGYHSAAQGAELVVGSDSPNTLDAAVVEGAANFARESGQHVPWTLYEPVDNRERYARIPDGLPLPSRRRFQRLETRWQAAHLMAVRECHAVIALGGHDNTLRACMAASERGKPVWPLPTLDGAAAEAFEDLSEKRWDRAHAASLRAAAPIAYLRSHAATASRWIALTLRSVFGRRSRDRRVYFLSYSHRNGAEADHVEVLLRRAKRGVLRDEVDFTVGKNLDESMEHAIEAADDVVVLDSTHAAESEWVDQEIIIARRRALADPARRLMGILLEGTPPRTALDRNVLHQVGTTRPERQDAVRTIVGQEPMR
jgi:hypothetical protein